jgi:hypothetical protein
MLYKLNILNFEIALFASGKPVGALCLFDVIIQLFPREYSALSTLVRTLKEVLGTLTLQMVQIVIVSKFRLRFTLFALESNFIQYFLNDQRMEFCAFVFNLAMRTIPITNLFGSQPLFNAHFAKPFLALKALLWVENHVMTN